LQTVQYGQRFGLVRVEWVCWTAFHEYNYCGHFQSAFYSFDSICFYALAWQQTQKIAVKIQLLENLGAADKLAVNVDLGKAAPVRVNLEPLGELGIS
jgi:hypothetical protein